MAFSHVCISLCERYVMIYIHENIYASIFERRYASNIIIKWINILSSHQYQRHLTYITPTKVTNFLPLLTKKEMLKGNIYKKFNNPISWCNGMHCYCREKVNVHKVICSSTLRKMFDVDKISVFWWVFHYRLKSVLC